MKNKVLLLGVLIFALVAVSVAQSVKITSKEITYKRTGQDVPDYKKTFTVKYPKVSGPAGPKIEAILNYEKAFDFKLQEEIKETYWLESADYTVNYNNYNILDVTLF